MDKHEQNWLKAQLDRDMPELVATMTDEHWSQLYTVVDAALARGVSYGEALLVLYEKMEEVRRPKK